jgi:hypothetical protein
MNFKFKILFLVLVIIIYIVFIKYIIETHVDLPEGSWKNTCTALSWFNPELTAECTDLQGRPVISSINLNTCTEIELNPEQTEHRNEGRDLEHKHYHGNRGSYYHIHKLINDNGKLKCDSIQVVE